MGTSVRLGPTPRPGLGGSGPKAWIGFPAIPRRPALLQAQLCCLNQRAIGAGLSLSVALSPLTRRRIQASAQGGLEAEPSSVNPEAPTSQPGAGSVSKGK